MDVALAADRRCVAEIARHLFYRLDQVMFRLGRRVECCELLEGEGCKNGAGPGPKVLCREISATNKAKVVVDVGRLDSAAPAILVWVLEEIVAGYDMVLVADA